MDDLFSVLKLISAIILGLLSYLFGGWDVLIRVLVTLTVLDIITGVTVAFINCNLCSKVAWAGFARKIGTYVIVAVAVQLDMLFGTDMLRGLTVGFFIGVEGISILENWGNAGLPMPKKLRAILEQLKNENDE